MAVLVRMGQIMKRNCQVGISLHLMGLELSDSCQTWNSREQRSGQIYLHSGKECSFIYTVEKGVPLFTQWKRVFLYLHSGKTCSFFVTPQRFAFQCQC